MPTLLRLAHGSADGNGLGRRAVDAPFLDLGPGARRTWQVAATERYSTQILRCHPISAHFQVGTLSTMLSKPAHVDDVDNGQGASPPTATEVICNSG